MIRYASQQDLMRQHDSRSRRAAALQLLHFVRLNALGNALDQAFGWKWFFQKVVNAVFQGMDGG